MEALIKDQLMAFRFRKTVISKHQRGSMHKHSTTTTLHECTHDWNVGLSYGNYFDVVYFDFRNAFDSIVFPKLLAKLKHFGIVSNLLAWISYFLHGRTLRYNSSFIG
jgi:Reverse transcriptase (RNA-dependent DNA polymerase)